MKKTLLIIILLLTMVLPTFATDRLLCLDIHNDDVILEQNYNTEREVRLTKSHNSFHLLNINTNRKNKSKDV